MRYNQKQKKKPTFRDLELKKEILMENIQELNPELLLVMEYKYANSVAIYGNDSNVMFVKKLLEHPDDQVIMQAYNISEKLFANVAYGENIIDAIANLNKKIENRCQGPHYTSSTEDMHMISKNFNDSELSSFLFALEKAIDFSDMSYILKITQDTKKEYNLGDNYFGNLLDYLRRVSLLRHGNEK